MVIYVIKKAKLGLRFLHFKDGTELLAFVYTTCCTRFFDFYFAQQR